MQRSTLAFGTATIAAAVLLAACGGGGGGATRSSVPGVTPTGQPSSAPVQPSGKTTKLTLTIHRKPASVKLPWSSAAVKATAAKRTPKYLSENVAGLQIAITAGAQNLTLYADLSDVNNNPLCVGEATAANNYTQTCVIPISMLAASETITVTELDAPPLNETNGFGTGFPTSADVLAVGSATATAATAGSTGVTLIGLSPVIANLGSLGPAPFGDVAVDQNNGRVVVLAGTPALDVDATVAGDESGAAGDDDQTPLPFVDLNGSAVPLTVEALSGAGTATQDVLVYPYRNAGFLNNPSVYVNEGTGTIVPPPAGGLAQSVSIPTDDYLWAGALIIYAFSYDGATPPASAPYYVFGVQNNLTIAPGTVGFAASNSGIPYTASSYTLLAPLSQSVTSTSLTVGATASATVTDYGSVDGVNASLCLDANGNPGVAAVVAAGAYNVTAGTQGYTVAPISAGSCTFNFSDGDTGIPLAPLTVTVSAQANSPITASPTTVTLDASGSPATLTASESAYAGTFTPTLTCQDTSPAPTNSMPTLASTAAATSFTIDTGADSAVCALVLSDTNGHSVTVPVLESALEAGFNSKHRKTK
ncbi:MAG: hypothetical protein ABR975_06515 [Vulcanimicrobiaceae bacterium]|jgi:hypothetical protein